MASVSVRISSISSSAAVSWPRNAHETMRVVNAEKALFYPARQREFLRQAEAARQLGRRESPGQLEQSQGVSPGFGQDPRSDLLIERPRHDRAQQRPGVGIPESPDSELGDPLEVLARLAGSERQEHALGLDPASGEGERLGRCLVQPLTVVHDADERLLPGRLRQQAQHGQADEEAIGGRPLPQAEGGAERVRLRPGQVLEMTEHRQAQLLEARERQLHL
jgi:hypothetical protein